MTSASWQAIVKLDAVVSYRFRSRVGSTCDNTVRRVRSKVSRPPGRPTQRIGMKPHPNLRRGVTAVVVAVPTAALLAGCRSSPSSSPEGRSDDGDHTGAIPSEQRLEWWGLSGGA